MNLGRWRIREGTGDGEGCLHALAWLALALLFAFGVGLMLSGCSSVRPPVRYTAPSAAPARENVRVASEQVKATRGGIGRARENVTAAGAAAAALSEEVDAALKPQVEGLRLRLTMALRDLAEADARAEQAETALAESDKRLGDLQGAIDRQTSALNAEADAKNRALADLTKTKAALSHQTALAWKWRLISLAIVLLVAGFFVARQYFPFLKLI